MLLRQATQRERPGECLGAGQITRNTLTRKTIFSRGHVRSHGQDTLESTRGLRVLSANNRMSQEYLFITKSVSLQALTCILNVQEDSGEHVIGGADGTRIRLRRLGNQ